MSRSGRTALALLLLTAASSSARPADAAPLRFRHPEPARVAGYRLHATLDTRPPSPTPFAVTVDLGAVPAAPNQVVSVELPLPVGAGWRWRVALSAYDAGGRASAFSNEILVDAAGVRGRDDGVADDGDGSGLPGDAPCPSGRSAGCDDNCPFTPNGPGAGTCIEGDPLRRGRPCATDAGCGSGGLCSLRQEDRDGDGIGDACDNCLALANPSQRDPELDGFGAACDPDFDGDGAVGGPDFGLLAAAWNRRAGQSGYLAAADVDGDGVVDARDLAGLDFGVGASPGPSGLGCAGSGVDGVCLEGACALATADGDGDGVGDECDVCLLEADPFQHDGDGDGYGNACDFDYNNDGRADAADALLFSYAYGARTGDRYYNERFDHDMDGWIGPWDATLRSLRGPVVGPSGLACAGTTPCR